MVAKGEDSALPGWPVLGGTSQGLKMVGEASRLCQVLFRQVDWGDGAVPLILNSGGLHVLGEYPAQE